MQGSNIFVLRGLIFNRMKYFCYKVVSFRGIKIKQKLVLARLLIYYGIGCSIFSKYFEKI
jgi:hypothetical protein